MEDNNEEGDGKEPPAHSDTKDYPGEVKASPRLYYPYSSSNLIRSWSRRSLQLCLKHEASLQAEFEEQEPETWQQAYLQGFRSLFDDQVACDIFFSFASDATIKIGAHRCILEARKFQPLLEATKIERNQLGQEIVLVEGKFQEGYQEELRQAIASVYGINSARTVKNEQFKPIVPKEVDAILNDLHMMDPGKVQEFAPLRDLLLEVIEYQPYWTLDRLKRSICNYAEGYVFGPQFDARIQVILKESGFYQVSGPYRDQWIADHRKLAAKLSPETNHSQETKRLPAPDVKFVASPNASSEAQEVWSLEAHKALICAHSEYFRSWLTHEGWSFETEPTTFGNSKQQRIILRLDSNQFTKETMSFLISCCYGGWVFVPTMECRLDLIRGATYFGMKAASLLFEESLVTKVDWPSLPSLYQFSQDHGAERLRVECHKYACRSLPQMTRALSQPMEPAGLGRGGPLVTETLPILPYPLIEAILKSDFVDANEDAILGFLLHWADLSKATFDETKELLRLVRLPFVPVNSPVMEKATTQNLVNEDLLRICRLFQTDSDCRATMINSEPMYKPRFSEETKRQLVVDCRSFQHPRRHNEHPCLRIVARMLGTVNGRHNFHEIDSVRLNPRGDRLQCTFSTQLFTPVDHNVSFGELITDEMPTEEDRKRDYVDISRLEAMEVEEAKILLAAILRRENNLRLHPRVQAVFGSLGEDETAMSQFITALQRHVAREFHVDPIVGTELIRSAATLFPETAKLAHYVRHNRCFEGNLKIGDAAPDVSLLTIGGTRTSLWTELDRHHDKQEKPVLILGASFT